MSRRGHSEFKFSSTEEIVDAVKETVTERQFDPSVEDDRAPKFRSVLWSDHVRWVAQKGKMVRIPRANVLFMEGNQWDIEHAASIYQYLVEGGTGPIRYPAGRVYRVAKSDVAQSEKFEEEGELEYQLGMTEPWDESDIGNYYAQLVDGNHRAAAALAFGESFIWVYVGENTLENVRKKDLK